MWPYQADLADGTKDGQDGLVYHHCRFSWSSSTELSGFHNLPLGTIVCSSVLAILKVGRHASPHETKS